MLGKNMKLFEFFKDVAVLNKNDALDIQQNLVNHLVTQFNTQRNFGRVHVNEELQNATSRKRRTSDPTMPPLANRENVAQSPQDSF